MYLCILFILHEKSVWCVDVRQLEWSGERAEGDFGFLCGDNV